MSARTLGLLALLAPLAWGAPNGMGGMPGMPGKPSSRPTTPQHTRPAPVLRLLKVSPEMVLSGDLEGRLARWSFAGGKLGAPIPAGQLDGAVLDLVLVGEHVLAVDDGGALYRLGKPDPVRLATHPGGAVALAARVDGELLATAGGDGTIRLWGLDGAERGVLQGHEGQVAQVVFDPNTPTRLWSVGHDGSLRSWKLRGGKGDKPYKGKSKVEHSLQRERTDLVATPDGAHLLSCNYTGAVTLWDVEKRKLKATPLPTRSNAEQARQIAVSPEGKRAVVALSGESALWVIELEHPKAPRRLDRGQDAPASVTFVDETTLAVGSFGGKVERVALGGGK